jgi:hypothetical protein
VPVAADELIARLEASRAQWRDARGVPTDLESEAAAALRASAEREKELVEALEEIELLQYGDETFVEDARRAHIIARAILEKHKECP